MFFLLFLITNYSNAQMIGYGGGSIYNFQTESIGFGLRIEIPKDQYSIVPQVSYYPSFNKIHEFYTGFSGHLNLIHIKIWTIYALANGSYNGWINHNSTSGIPGNFSNWAAEGGLGVTTNTWFCPFIEYRYNVKWRETNLRVGILFFFKTGKTNICNTYL